MDHCLHILSVESSLLQSLKAILYRSHVLRPCIGVYLLGEASSLSFFRSMVNVLVLKLAKSVPLLSHPCEPLPMDEYRERVARGDKDIETHVKLPPINQ